MSAPKLDEAHNHRYQRVILGGTRIIRDSDGRRRIEKTAGYEVFKCMIPGCTHYVPTELAIGRKGQCWKCGEQLILNSENIKLKRPTHVWCRKVREIA